MPTCNCAKVCNCFVDDNGAPIVVESFDPGIPATTLLDTPRIGSRDSVVVGSGRSTNPYSVSFKDSLEYRPRAQEWRQTGIDFYANNWVSDPTVYSTPIARATFLWAPSDPAVTFITAPGLIIGAWASVTSAAQPIEFQIFYDVQDGGDLGPDRVSGCSTNSVNSILACTGYVNPLRSSVDVGASGLRMSVIAQIRNPEGLTLTVNDVRIWAVEV